MTIETCKGARVTSPPISRFRNMQIFSPSPKSRPSFHGTTFLSLAGGPRSRDSTREYIGPSIYRTKVYVGDKVLLFKEKASKRAPENLTKKIKWIGDAKVYVFIQNLI